MTAAGAAAGEGAPLLDIRDLRIEARSRDGGWSEIVGGVDLTLRRGEVLGLIGESGAGKSTIGLAAMGYAREGCRVAGGRILFDGIDLATAGKAEKRRLRGARIAYVAQSAAAAFNPAHRLIRQFAEAPIRHGTSTQAEAYADARALYRRLSLPHPDTIGLRYPHQVSGGQLQRAMIAMAMACRPDLIVFDEPTTALDVTTQVEVLTSIRDVVRQFHTAALYITHDLAVVAQMADRIKVLRHGREVEEAETAAMLAAPREDYTRSLWAAQALAKPPSAPIRPDVVPVLAVEGVSAGYGPTPVLRDVGLALHRGRTLAVVGESGSGKSTLARVITGLLPPGAGRVLLDGGALPPGLPARSREERQRVQMITQSADTALNPRHTVGEIIGRPMAFYGGARGRALAARVEALLDMIGLPAHFARRYPGELSGGQKQRVGIARAFAGNPSVVVADEPVSALDVSVQAAVTQLLTDIQRRRGTTLIFISHDLSIVRYLADRVLVMYLGRIVEQGPTDAIFSPPYHPYTEALLAAVPIADPAIRKRKVILTGDIPSPSAPPPGCAFQTRCSHRIAGLCDRQEPPTQRFGPNHTIACHLPRGQLMAMAPVLMAAGPAAEAGLPA